MNIKPYLPLVAATVFAVGAGSALVATQSIQASDAASAPVAVQVVDLPTVTVRPDPQDLAWYQANRIVDLAAVSVRPDPADRAAFLASGSAQIVDLPAVTVTPAPEDLAWMAWMATSSTVLAGQLASR